MQRQSPSIFNDIVGPIMVGPSSSHTCAPSRIGYLCQQLVKGKLQKVEIEFAKEGAYTEMYKGQRSDMGFVNGLLGHRPEDPRTKDSFVLAEEAGLKVEFIISDFIPIKPNLSRITLYSDQDEIVRVDSDSTGGGTVKLLKIDGYDTDITGDCFELLIRTDALGEPAEQLMQECLKKIPTHEGYTLSQDQQGSLINIKSRSKFEEDIIDAIKAMDLIKKIQIINPILVVTSNQKAELPFHSAEELLALSEETGKALWELAINYEEIRSGWCPKEIKDYMRFLIETMEESITTALQGDIQMNGILEPTAGKIDQFMKTNKHALDMGILNLMVPWSMATMEYSSAMGVVLCAPTGGSAGVFPGAVLGAATMLNLTMDEKVKLMLTTSVIGIVMSKDCNYSAELYGCQVEPGAASAMAAGALVFMMDGTPKQSLMAASCALQNILGTICDPVAGMVQLPCISRNALSVANAVVSANMIMGGYDPLIPLDQTTETMFRVGKQLPSELRCTCKGGLCTTPYGQQLAKEQAERDNVRYK
ncbi:MAG: L-serine ammonia-lyase, iron-sulfur-dependent, subunit alpha [Eubacterium sp.]